MAALTAVAVVAPACAPWLSPATRPPLASAEWEMGFGIAWLAPPSARFWDGMPAPQVWAARGLGSGAELRTVYAPPATFDGRLRVKLVDRDGTSIDLHAGGGWLSFGGIFDVPTGGVPYLGGGAAVVRRAETAADRGAFGSIGLTAPFKPHEGDRTAWTAWASAMVGVETRAGDWRLAPQLGTIVPLARPREWIWFPGVSVYRRP